MTTYMHLQYMYVLIMRLINFTKSPRKKSSALFPKFVSIECAPVLIWAIAILHAPVHRVNEIIIGNSNCVNQVFKSIWNSQMIQFFFKVSWINHWINILALFDFPILLFQQPSIRIDRKTDLK